MTPARAVASVFTVAGVYSALMASQRDRRRWRRKKLNPVAPAPQRSSVAGSGVTTSKAKASRSAKGCDEAPPPMTTVVNEMGSNDRVSNKRKRSPKPKGSTKTLRPFAPTPASDGPLASRRSKSNRRIHGPSASAEYEMSTPVQFPVEKVRRRLLAPDGNDGVTETAEGGTSKTAGNASDSVNPE